MMNTAAEFPRTDMDTLCEIPEAIAKIQLIDVELFNKLQKCDLSESAKKDVARMKPHVRGASRLVELPVIYTRSKGANAFKVGRIYEKSKVGLQAMYRDVRAFLASGLYHDVDIVNAHMSMVAQLCEHWGMKPNQYENIRRYVEHRDEVLAAISPNRDAAKTEICRIMYGGIADEFELELSGTAIDMQMLRDMSAELDHVRALAYTKYTQLQKYEKVKKSRKPVVSLFAHLLHGLEAKVILCADSFFTSIGRRMDCLIHDGGLVRKLDGETELPAEVLQGLREYVREHTGFNLQWICKPMKHELKPREADSIPEHETYEAVKAEFEERRFMCDGCLYLLNKMGDERETKILSSNKASIQYANMWYKEFCKKSGAVVDKEFWPRWVKDPTRRSYERVEWHPKRDVSEHVFNMFTGYAHENRLLLCPEILERPRPCFKDTHIYTLIFEILANSCEKKYTWLMRLLHTLVFTPYKKSGCFPVFYSDARGSGKSSFTLLLTEIMGRNHITSANDCRTFFGKFNSALANKIVAVFEEGDVFQDAVPALKDLCTSPTYVLERKGRDPETHDAYAQLMMFTNHLKSIQMEPGCRRVSVFFCSEKYKGNKDFFDTLNDQIKDPVYIQSLYDDLNTNHSHNWNITDFQQNRPTDGADELQLKSEDAVVKYFHFLAENAEFPGQYEFNRQYTRTSVLYELFLQAMHKTPKEYGIILFGKKIQNENFKSFLSSKRDNKLGVTTIHVDHQKMREWLAGKGYIQL